MKHVPVLLLLLAAPACSATPEARAEALLRTVDGLRAACLIAEQQGWPMKPEQAAACESLLRGCPR